MSGAFVSQISADEADDEMEDGVYIAETSVINPAYWIAKYFIYIYIKVFGVTFEITFIFG